MFRFIRFMFDHRFLQLNTLKTTTSTQQVCRYCCRQRHPQQQYTILIVVMLQILSIQLLCCYIPMNLFCSSNQLFITAFVPTTTTIHLVHLVDGQNNNNNIKNCWNDHNLPCTSRYRRRHLRRWHWYSSRNDDDSNNDWLMTNRNMNDDNSDWQKVLLDKQDGTFWSSFEPSNNDSSIITTDDDDDDVTNNIDRNTSIIDDIEAEIWLDQLQSLASVEVEFNLQEADRADKVRQMEEWGFDRETIKNTLGVAIDTSLETIDDVIGMQTYREESFWYDDIDLTTVESHTQVEMDDETNETIRLQMVYVDEHTCIGCTNCAMIAQSTFFMHPEHGRARVFNQWGDTDETIQIAIETCPVDCIHYVPYDELVALEIDRRNQNINYKARLVSQAENGNSLSHLSGRGANAYTAPQRISGNMKSRCNNCPTRGCRTCPMFGVGQNPQYEIAEQRRKEKKAKRILQQQRERDQKSVEL
jgi:ferredoxin